MRILILACAAMAMGGAAGATECGVDAHGIPLVTTILGADGQPIPSLPMPDRSWRLLTQSYGGTVSLLKDLTKHECETLEAKLSWSCSAEQCTRMLTPDLIKSAECFQ